MARRTGALLALLAWPHPAAAAPADAPPALAAPMASADPSAPPTSPPAPGPAAGETPVPPSPAAPAAVAVPSRKGFSLEAGWGYYEVSHVGVAYNVTERAVFDLLGGLGFAGEGTKTSLGLGFRHALGKPIKLGGPIKTLEWGWGLKALFWKQTDPNYDWTNLSFVFGGYLLRDLNPRLALKLDAGVALSGALESDRKQNDTFGHPQRWNGSVCLEAVYRFGGP